MFNHQSIHNNFWVVRPNGTSLPQPEPIRPFTQHRNCEVWWSPMKLQHIYPLSSMNNRCGFQRLVYTEYHFTNFTTMLSSIVPAINKCSAKLLRSGCAPNRKLETNGKFSLIAATKNSMHISLDLVYIPKEKLATIVHTGQASPVHYSDMYS